MSSTSLQRISTFVLFSFLLFQQVFAQTKTITGKVSDENGIPVADASVLIKSTKNGTVTAADGSFSIAVPVNAKALTISHLGFASQEIAITKTVQVAVKLIAESSSLNDVVVVGYGTARKKDVTGAVSSISVKDFNQGLVTTPMDQVQGKIPGLVITKPDGDPNSNPIIRIRGQTSLLGSQTPLLVVDGVILDNYEILSSIPTADIISFDFLKDASAASIYGARGANGVIIITTKKGKEGSLQVDYSGYGTQSKDAKYYDLLNTPQFLQHAQALGYDTAAINSQGGHGTSTDWQRLITRTGYTQSHALGLSGGTKGFTYHGSLTYQDQQGIVINTGRQQLGLRLNAQQKALNNKLVIDINVLNTETKHQNIDANIFYWAYNIPPVVPEIINGVENPIYNYNYVNPVWMQNNELKRSVDYLKQSNIAVNYELLKGLIVGVAGNISRLNAQYDYYLPQIPGANGGILNQAFKNNANTNSDRGDIHFNYAGSIGKNNFTATGVYEYNHFRNDNYFARASGFLVDANQNNALGSGIPSFNNINSYREESKLISFLGRITYNYDSKYYLTGSVRRDGSSKFGVNNQWGIFPAVSAAWRISKENFLKNVSWIDELKINAGYGITGNSDPIGGYNTQLLLSGSVRTYDPTSTLNPYPVGYVANQNPNPDLKWEKRVGQNIGLEYSFFKSRVTGSFSAFNDKTNDMLYTYGVQTPPNFVSTVLANVGSMTNKGVELGINVEIIRSKDFSWALGGQITSVRTNVTSLSGTWNGNAVASDQIQLTSAGGQGLSFNPLTYLKVGKYPSVFFLPHYVGQDKDGNQLLDSAGVKSVLIGGNPTYYYTDPSPKFTYGFNTSFRYKAWSLAAAFTGNYGQKIYNNARLNLSNLPRFPGLNVLKETFTNGLKDAPTTSDYWLEKASYLRLQNLTIAYNFHKIKGIENLRVYFTGTNLFVITKYKGLDPEISPSNGAGGSAAGIGNLASNLASAYGGLGGGGTGQGYIDNNYSGSGFYPRARSFTLGVAISIK